MCTYHYIFNTLSNITITLPRQQREDLLFLLCFTQSVAFGLLLLHTHSAPSPVLNSLPLLMFARVPGTNAADAARLREIDVANENQHDHSTFISHFLSTHAYSTITTFIQHLNTAARSTTLTAAASHTQHPPPITALLDLLARVEAVIGAHPPVVSGGGVASRFGNAAFRDVVADISKLSSGWLRDMITAQLQARQLPVVHAGRQRLIVSEERADGEQDGHGHENEADSQQPHSHTHLPKNLPAKVVESLKARGEWPNEHSQHADYGQQHQHTERGDEQTATEAGVGEELSDSERLDRVVSCIALYFNASFGDRQRIDYGTGHELNFVCFLYTLTAIHFVPVDSAATTDSSSDYFTALALVVFPRYLSIMRRLQSAYLLEPAGSRGVWGLDDYSFLPFLLGSSQLINHPHIRPRSVRYPEVLEQYSTDFLYCDAIRWVLAVKSVSFAEHSPMLNDITSVRGGWQQVNGGLWRMYEQEVLRKYPIVQHFIFTDLLSTRLIKPVERQCLLRHMQRQCSSLCCATTCCTGLAYTTRVGNDLCVVLL